MLILKCVSKRTKGGRHNTGGAYEYEKKVYKKGQRVQGDIQGS